jgi:hypothetical protein
VEKPTVELGAYLSGLHWSKTDEICWWYTSCFCSLAMFAVHQCKYGTPAVKTVYHSRLFNTWTIFAFCGESCMKSSLTSVHLKSVAINLPHFLLSHCFIWCWAITDAGVGSVAACPAAGQPPRYRAAAEAVLVHHLWPSLRRSLQEQNLLPHFLQVQLKGVWHEILNFFMNHFSPGPLSIPLSLF